MNRTQYLIFEACKACNLGKVHSRCPNMSPLRYAHVTTNRPLSDSTIVSTAAAMYLEHGFDGRIGWHYYNEPLMAEKRLWRLMDAIDKEAPQAAYTLWTNGTRWPNEPENLSRFAEVHLTDYRLPKYPVNLAAWRESVPGLHIHNWDLDDRLNMIGPESLRPCRRMFTEMICDFFGNVRLCCYDWQGLGCIGNVQDMAPAEVVKRWQEVRDTISGTAMTAEAPNVCKLCNMRSRGITRFVPGPADRAEDYVRGLP